jgi:hypothetical protein
MPTKRHDIEEKSFLSPIRFIPLHNAANRLVCGHLYDEPPIHSVQRLCEFYDVDSRDIWKYCCYIYQCTPIELLDWARGKWMLKEIEKSADVKFLVLQIRLGYENSRGAFWTFQKRVYGRAGRKLKQEIEPAKEYLHNRFAKLAEIIKIKKEMGEI